MMLKYTLGEIVATKFGNAVVVGIDPDTYTFPSYQLDFNCPQDFPFNPWFDEMDLRKIGIIQLELF